MSDITTGRNNPWLDLVRSGAIVLILLRHGERALHTAAGEPAQSFLQTIFMNGWVGVDLFFVLSGYLIAMHLLRAGVGSGDFIVWRYLAMRALRIVPAYYAVLALVAAGAFPLFSVNPQLLPVRIGYHLAFLQDYLPSDINVVFWSLGVEEKFYLLAPLLIFALLWLRAGWLRFAILVLCFVLPFGLRTAAFLQLHDSLDYPEFWRIFRSPFHMTLEGLVVGVGIAIAQHSGLVRPSPKIGLTILGAGAAVSVASLASHDFMAVLDLGDATLQPALIAILAGAITLGAVQLVGVSMPLTRSFQLLSRLSYSLYLIHYPLIPLVLAITAKHGASAFWLGYLSVSLGAALLLHLAIERPFLRVKDGLARRGAIGTAPSADKAKLPTAAPT
jgi:peptidoglycan/LPS O-acetylase OafA/YrhL